jgi:hypothetical protein
LCDVLGEVGLRLCRDKASSDRLETVRALYEPHAKAFSQYLRMPLPVWVPEKREKDQWKLLTKLRSEAEAMRGSGAPLASALLRHDEKGH